VINAVYAIVLFIGSHCQLLVEISLTMQSFVMQHHRTHSYCWCLWR